MFSTSVQQEMSDIPVRSMVATSENNCPVRAQYVSATQHTHRAADLREARACLLLLCVSAAVLCVSWSSLREELGDTEEEGIQLLRKSPPRHCQAVQVWK